MTEINFRIEDWSAWAPGLEDKKDWIAWANKEKTVSPDHSKSPKIDFIPAMSRRRLGQLTKMSLKTSFDCTKNLNNIISVFASRYGEWQQTVKILQSISEGSEISPAGFSLSVHNTAAGIHSITSKNKSPYSAISANEMTFQTALIEALGRLQKQQNILLVIGEENTPEIYKEKFSQNSHPFAISLLLSKENPNITLRHSCKEENEAIDALDFLKSYINSSNKQKLSSNLFELEIN